MQEEGAELYQIKFDMLATQEAECEKQLAYWAARQEELKQLRAQCAADLESFLNVK